MCVVCGCYCFFGLPRVGFDWYESGSSEWDLSSEMSRFRSSVDLF